MLGAILKVLVPITWGAGGYFGGLHAPHSGHAFEGVLWIGMGYILWCSIILLATGGSALPGVKSSGTAILFGLCYGLMFSVGGAVFALAMRYNPPVEVIGYSALYPAVGALLAFFFSQDPLTTKKVIGIVLAVVAGLLLA